MLSLERSTSIDMPRERGENLSLCLRDLLLSEVEGDAFVDLESVSVLSARLRKEVRLYPMTKEERFENVAAADAGSQILQLASRRYGVMSALVYGAPSGIKFWMRPESVSLPYALSTGRFEGIVNVRREAKLYETAAEFLRTRPETELMIVDGPLVFSDWWRLSGCRKDQDRLLRAVNGLLRLGSEMGVALAGFVKRPSARYLLGSLGLVYETQLPDSYLLLHALKPGERTDVFSPSKGAERAGRPSPFMDQVEIPVYSFYSRTTRDWSIPPTRVDIPVSSLGRLDDIADYCYATTVINGIPLVVARADEGVKITRRFVAEVYGEALARTGRRIGEVRCLAPYWGEGGWMGA